MPTLKYAELYDEFRNTDGVKQAQTAVWKRFVPFEEPGPLSLADWRELHAAIDDARGLDFAMGPRTGNLRSSMALLSASGPRCRPTWPASPVRSPGSTFASRS
jgi:hypothetical protein